MQLAQLGLIMLGLCQYHSVYYWRKVSKLFKQNFTNKMVLKQAHLFQQDNWQTSIST